MNTGARIAVHRPLSGLGASLKTECMKIQKARTFKITTAIYLFLMVVCGFFMFILKDPDMAKSLGLIGAKAQILGGKADWPSLINLSLLMVSVGGLVIFGFIFVWIFGREFTDKTVYDILALPTSRTSLVAGKLIAAAGWAVTLILSGIALTLAIGGILQLPGWSGQLAADGIMRTIMTGLLTIIVCIVFAPVACVFRGYLPAVGCIFLVLLFGEILNTLGYGLYYPWAIPMSYSGAAQAMTGTAGEAVGAAGYLLVGLTGVLSAAATGVWWRSADHP
jgi:ABC-2 type transport system permease protein